MSELYHYGRSKTDGAPVGSGRFPLGSGDDPFQHGSGGVRAQIKILKSQGITNEKDIARALGFSTKELRERISAESQRQRHDEMIQIEKLMQKHKTIPEISKELGIPQSTIRSRLEEKTKERAKHIEIADKKLKETVDQKGYVDVGPGVEQQLGITRDRLNKSVAKLQEQGYAVHNIQVQQLGTEIGNKTTIKVLAKPGTTIKDVYDNKDKISMVDVYEEKDVKAPNAFKPPANLDSSRIKIRYAEEGGIEKDGVIELRRGVQDLDLGASRYAQVRIAVDGTHYLKGMAVYSDNIPDGVDVVFNTNKSVGTPKEKVFKELNPDPNNPFGAAIKPNGQREYIDQNGNTRLSVINKVNEEGDWLEWSKNLPSQMLSKQPVTLAKQQLGLSYIDRKAEFDEINSLTNPTLKKFMMEKFADSCDAAAVHLKAAAMPRQATHVILPLTSISPREIYAPKYEDGETVVLIRFPHQSKSEIPELVVNNKNREAKKIMNNALDAVGINHVVAEQLSGADFDGDTVLVIPNNDGAIQTDKIMKELKGFDPKREYAGYPGMIKMSEDEKQIQMGKITNLVTDMTMKGAPADKLAFAIKHAQVVIDAPKHGLDYKRSEKENHIKELKKEYQGSANAGASTIISRAKSQARVPVRKELTSTKDMTPEELKAWNAGKKVYRATGETYTTKDGKVHERLFKSTKMYEAEDARDLIGSSHPMEKVYANYANQMKAMANEARKVVRTTADIERNSSARIAYLEETKTLTAKLNTALKNAPYERKAQVIANVACDAIFAANPDMSKEDKKKTRGRQLKVARDRVGAKKERVNITPREWEAIQSGAISKTMLNSILNNTDLDKVKALATPKTNLVMTPAKISQAKALANLNLTQAQIAARLGVSPSTVAKALKS